MPLHKSSMALVTSRTTPRPGGEPIWIDPNAASSMISLTIEDGRIQQITELSKGDLAKTSIHKIPLNRSNTYPGKTQEEKAKAELVDVGERVTKYIKEHPDAELIHVEMSRAAYQLMARTMNSRSTLEQQVDALNELMGRPVHERTSTASIESRSNEQRTKTNERNDALTAAPSIERAVNPNRRQPENANEQHIEPNSRPPAGARSARGLA